MGGKFLLRGVLAEDIVTKHHVGGKTMLQKLIGFFKDEEGATAVEYALFVALIAAIIVIAVQNIGSKANTAFTKIDNAMPAK